MFQDLLTIVAVLEALFLIGNLIAWRRTYLWGQEMQQLNTDLAKALHLASEGKYAEAEEKAKLWKNRLAVLQSELPVWKIVDGKPVEWPWWRRWLDV